MFLHLISLGLLVSAANGVSAQQKPSSGSGSGTQAKADQGLHSLMVAAGKLYFGTAIETNNFNDQAYMAIANDRNEFGLYVPENSQKWEAIQPAVNTFSFAAPDSVEALAKKNGQMFRCHTLTWHSQLPTFGMFVVLITYP
jgi:endo-1,4-beta-xylanase